MSNTLSPPELKRLLSMRTDWFKTATGNIVFITDPKISTVTVEDIARSLSRQCRYAGHLKDDVETYVVAQHSIMVSWLVEQTHPRLSYQALMHDAVEAYIQDLIRPLKLNMPGYMPLEDEWTRYVCSQFHIPCEHNSVIKQADRAIQFAERRDLTIGGIEPTNDPKAYELADMWPATIRPWSPSCSRSVFLETYHRLRAMYLADKPPTDDRVPYSGD